MKASKTKRSARQTNVDRSSRSRKHSGPELSTKQTKPLAAEVPEKIQRVDVSEIDDTAGEHPLPDDPTPEQIAKRSEEIRQRWSDRVKKKRHLRAPVRWSVPNVQLADIDYPSSN